jgi:capsular polysaccharide transport system permease protein
MNVETIERDALRATARVRTARGTLHRHRWLALFVGLPTLLAILYYGLIASDVYISQSSFVIKSPGQRAAPTMSLANLVQTSGLSAGQEQTKEIVGYIRSRTGLKDLQTQVDVEQYYSARGADFLSRFPGPFDSDTFEDLYHYYQSRVSADIDKESGLAMLRVQAFTPDDAFRMNARLLDLSERLVNRLNQRAENRAIAEAQRRVIQAEERVRNARVALSAYRNQVDLIDPAKQATGVLEVSNKLSAEQAALQAQLDLMRRVAPRHPSIPSIRSRIVAIGMEIGSQTGRVVGTPSAIASKLATYEKLDVEQEFATQTLAAANTSLEQARTEAQKQKFYLERVVEPNKPDDATLPQRLKQILIVFAASLCLYFIGWMLVIGILEHAPED